MISQSSSDDPFPSLIRSFWNLATWGIAWKEECQAENLFRGPLFWLCSARSWFSTLLSLLFWSSNTLAMLLFQADTSELRFQLHKLIRQSFRLPVCLFAQQPCTFNETMNLILQQITDSAVGWAERGISRGREVP